MGYSMASARRGHGRNHQSIVRLLESVRQDRSPATLESLWRGVFALPSWHLLVHGAPPAVRPGTLRIDGKAFLLAFTTRAAAESFLRGPCRDAHSADGILELTPEAAVTAMESAPAWTADGSIYGVLFDEGPSGFYAPLHAMGEMRGIERFELTGADDAVLLRIPGRELRELMEGDPELGLRLALGLGRAAALKLLDHDRAG